MSAHGPTGSPVSWNICVGHTPRHAGLFRGIQDFRRALDGRILSFDPAGRPPPASDGDHTGVVRVACGGTALHRHCHLLSRQAAREADDAVAGADLLIAHSMFRAHCSWTRSSAARHGCGYWAVPHGCLDPRGMRRRAVWKRLWMWREGCEFLAATDRVVFATRRERDKALPWLRDAGVVGAGGRTTATDAVIPWPVSLPDLTDRDAARTRVRQRLDIREDERILLWVGRLHSTKRPLETISAFVAAAPLDCHLVLVGMDEDLTATGVAARIPAGFGDRIHVVGELTGRALEEMRLAADGYISLSMKENFGYSAAEALACGLPVILSPGHDLAADLPMRGDRLACGWLLPDDSIAAARRAITEFSDMTRGGDAPASLARDMGMTGRRWAADQLAFDRFRDRLVELAGVTATRLPGHRRP